MCISGGLFCDSSAMCLCVCVCFCATCLLSYYTSHLMAPFWMQQTESQKAGTKSPLLKKQKHKKEAKTMLLCVKPYNLIVFGWHVMMKKISVLKSSTLSLPVDNGSFTLSRSVQFLQCQLLRQSIVQAWAPRGLLCQLPFGWPATVSRTSGTRDLREFVSVWEKEGGEGGMD